MLIKNIPPGRKTRQEPTDRVLGESEVIPSTTNADVLKNVEAAAGETERQS